MTPPFVVVSDFDGTITTQDLVVALTTRVNPASFQLIDQIYHQQQDLKTGLNLLFSKLPSEDRPLYEDYLSQVAQFRSGYHRFVTVLGQAAIPFYIVSNGLDFMLEAVLGPNDPRGPNRISNIARFDTPTIGINWQYACRRPCPGGCGLCKYSVVEELAARHAAPVIYIGDGVTDVNGAKRAQRVYARDRLAEILETHGTPYLQFDTFDDILSDLFTTTEVLPHE